MQNHNQPMKSRFEDCYFSIMGDSISSYEGYVPKDFPSFYSRHDAFFTGIYGYRDTWWGQVLDHFGARLLVNNSWSGSYVCKVPGCEIESYGCSDARTKGLGINGLTPDHIIVFLGSNDRGACLPLTSDDQTSLAVIENAYRVMLDKIMRNYPSAEIWCCTFPVTTCSRDRYFTFPTTQMGVPMKDYGALVQKVAKEACCHIIDLWDENSLCDTIEGLHPNFNGMKMIADKVISAMKAQS